MWSIPKTAGRHRLMVNAGMARGVSGPAELVTAKLQLTGPDWELRTAMSVPAGPTRLGELLPLMQSFADAVVGSAVKEVEAREERISCKKGCGACCRQLVPMAEGEARQLHAVVERLSEPRRSTVRARFAEARRRLEAAGLSEKLLYPDRWSDGEGRSIGLAYFRLGIPCPFLEEESCSLYADRPIACREYLVTSPADNCARPTSESVACVKLPFKVWTAIARFDDVPPSARFIRWVPLILALDWAEAHSDETTPRPGPDWLREFFDHVTGKRPPLAQPVPLPRDPDSFLPSSDQEPRR
jgi:Fe-S-cluster containining protein